MTIKVPGQMGPHFTITEKSAYEALQATLEKEGARNLVGELCRLMNRREVTDVADLFDAKTAGLVFGPAAVVRDMAESARWGQAENYTYHFAMTAIVYAMALEKLDPGFFEEKKHSMPQDREGYEQKRQEIMAYVRSLEPTDPVLSVACQQCGAVPGERCKSSNDWGHHAERFAAHEALKGGPRL